MTNKQFIFFGKSGVIKSVTFDLLFIYLQLKR